MNDSTVLPHPLLQIKDLQVDFVTENGRSTAVQDISLTVNRGEILAIVGESGSGKSVTSLSVLQLLPQPPARYAQGEILFSENGEAVVDLLRQSPEEMQAIRGNQVAMIFQEPMTSLNPVFSCGNQVMEAIRQHRKIPAREARREAIALFEKVKLPDPATIFDRYPHQLSGGQKQRVMIAMAMSCHPSLLICDEPTTALDVTVQQTILQLIRELQQSEQMGVIFITHDLGVVADIADRAVVMYKGLIVEQGAIQSLFTAPQHPYTRALLACRPVLHAKKERLPVVSDFMEVDARGMITERPGRGNPVTGRADAGPKPEAPVPGMEQEPPAPSGAGQDILLQVANLRVWFAGRKTFLGKPRSWVKAVDDVSFEVHRGETLGLVGESGCGKTTLGRTLLRLIEPTAGRIRYEGKDLLSMKGRALKKLRKDIQIIFQDPYSSLNPRLTIGEAIAEPLRIHDLVSSRRQQEEKIAALLEKVNLDPGQLHRYPHEFSGGQRQRIVIARALALDPSFIVCDESVSALDVSVQAQVLNLLGDLKKEFGFTIIFISHDLSVVRYISDRILVMNKGRIEEIGEAEALYRHPQTAYTRRLLAAIPGRQAP